MEKIIDTEVESKETESETESEETESEEPDSDKSNILPEIPETKKQPTQSSLPPEPTNVGCSKQKLVWCLIGLFGLIIALSICLVNILRA